VKVEQAIFGEHRSGHALRGASGDEIIAAELTSRLDLPDTAPPGVEWSPFVSGFPHGDRYVIARTFLDEDAPRAGMVISHALIMPLNEVVRSVNLQPLFDLLIKQGQPPAELLTVHLDLNDKIPAPSSDLIGVAGALAARAPGPVVRLGHIGFDDLIVSVWSQLWPEIRKTFAFRLSFGPSDLVEAPTPMLVCTPHALVARWQGYRITDTSVREPASLAAAMLSGHNEGAPLREFALEIGASLVSFSELPLLEQAYRLTMLETDTIENVLAAVRLVEKLSPDSKRGITGKGSLLNRLILHVNNADASGILHMRNLRLTGFEQQDKFWAEVKRWVADSSFPAMQDDGIRSIIEDATLRSGAVEEWRSAVIGGLAKASKSKRGAFASGFWRWAEAAPTITRPLVEHVELDSGLEQLLVKAAPSKLRRDAVDEVLKVAAEHGSLRLHGVAASAAYPPPQAARLQITVDRDPSVFDGVKLALRNATPAQVLTSALEVQDSRLVEIAAEAVAKSPSILARTDMREATAQKIWAAALARNLGAWQGPKNPREAFDMVLTNVLDRYTALPELVDILSQTPLADLTDFPRRVEVWTKFGGTTRRNLIQSTAEGWIERARNGMPPFGLDGDLQSAVLSSSKLDDLLNALATGRIATGVHVVAAIPAFDEQRFRRWLQIANDRNQTVPVADAEAVGRLTLDRKWYNVADDMVYLLRRGREDMRPALRVCVPLLSLITCWLHNLSSLTPSEKWESLEEVAAELYPSGPSHDDVWERSGGRNADLQWAGNGRSRWRDALNQLRRGGKGPRVDRLLHEMQTDYPQNEHLRFLARDYEFNGRR
jgi:hypothetical protein